MVNEVGGSPAPSTAELRQDGPDTTGGLARPTRHAPATTAGADFGPSAADEARRASLINALRSTLPALKLLTDPGDRESYRRDETAWLEAGLPLAVALPTSTSEVATIVRLAHEHGVPVVPRGAGSGLSGGSAGVEGALTVCLIGMDRVLEIDHDDLVAVTQPGILNATFKATVAAEGLFYAPDPASYEICSIGGNLGTNAGGLCCVKYGQTRESVLGLEIVLADGRVIRTGGRNVKDVAGYALTQLFVGSQGTLGIVTEAILRLRPAPPPRQTLLAFFPTLEAAGEAVGMMTKKGLTPVTLELMDRYTIAAVDDWQHLGLDRDAAAMLMIETDLPGAAASAQLDIAEAGAKAGGATSLVRAADPQEADWLRQGRREAFHALERLGVARMEDVGVPRSRIPAMIRAIEGIAAKHDVRIGTFGHVGDGNLHPTFVFDRDDPNAKGTNEAARADLYRAALALGGTITAEHGLGLTRRDFLVEQVGEDVLDVMWSIKRALDPKGTLNPGKFLPPVAARAS